MVRVAALTLTRTLWSLCLSPSLTLSLTLSRCASPS